MNKIIVSQDDFGKNHITSKPNCYCHTYYHNNILHLFALPSLVAVIVLAKKSLSKQQILLLIAELSSFPPLLKRELFIYVSTEQAAFYTESLLTNMLAMGLIETNESEIQTPAADSQEFYSAWLLNRSIQETFHPYAVVLTLLSKQKRVRRSVLEKTSAQFAERLATLHGLKPLEFFDKKGLSTLIQA